MSYTEILRTCSNRQDSENPHRPSLSMHRRSLSKRCEQSRLLARGGYYAPQYHCVELQLDELMIACCSAVLRYECRLFGGRAVHNLQSSPSPTRKGSPQNRKYCNHLVDFHPISTVVTPPGSRRTECIASLLCVSSSYRHCALVHRHHRIVG